MYERLFKEVKRLLERRKFGFREHDLHCWLNYVYWLHRRGLKKTLIPGRLASQFRDYIISRRQ